MKKLILLFGTLLSLSLFISASNVGMAAWDPLGNACSGKGKGSAACQNVNSEGNPINDTIINVTNLVALVTGVIAVVIIIYAGFRFITGGSNSDSVRAAREMLIYAVVGLVVIVFARTIIVFVAYKLL